MATEPIIRISQKLPTSQRDWEEFLRRLNSAIRWDGERMVMDALSTISERTGTDMDTLLSYLTDAGKVEDQRFLPQVSAGNVLSKQDVGPVTATASLVASSIDIAAHSVQYGFGTVAYNSGSITGLVHSTNYYVYADDPDYLGGAVTYLATTNPQTITADNGRYFVGAVRTTIAQVTTNIIAATSANPVAFQTSIAHGWATGNTVDFASLPGDFGSRFNADAFLITVTGADTFTVQVDGTTFAAYTVGGTVTRLLAASSVGGNGGGGGWTEGAFDGYTY
jgi:predicted membrane protein